MLPIHCLQLPNSVSKKLLDSGFVYVEDVFLKKDEGLFHPEVEKILKPFPNLKIVFVGFKHKTVNAKDLLESERKCQRVLTFSYRLDRLLGGGMPLGAIVEVCGAPGSGKTQLCLQLCVSVQLHESLGGLQGEAIFIDTESSFTPERIKEIGDGCKTHCCEVAKANKFSDDLLKTIQGQVFTDYYYRNIFDYNELLNTVFSLDEFLQSHKKVKILIIDSLAFPFLELTDMLKRTTLLCKILRRLKKLAIKHNLSVLVTNHLTTRICRGENHLSPALGDCVGSLMNHRLMFGFLPTEDHFGCVVFKNPVFPSDSAIFQVTAGGIRDVQ